MELFCIALKRQAKFRFGTRAWRRGWKNRGRKRYRMWRKSIGKGKESGRQLSTNYISRSCFCLSPPLPSKCFEEYVFDNVSRGNVSPLKTFGISRIIVRAFLSSSETKRIQQCRMRITS